MLVFGDSSVHSTVHYQAHYTSQAESLFVYENLVADFHLDANALLRNLALDA